jgi:AbrB family looped-hinge helix DNA binding protein
MSKVTSKLQVTIPKAIADQFGIKPGAELAWIASGDSIRVVPAAAQKAVEDQELRLKLFDEATARQRRREKRDPKRPAAKDRGWNREDLYRRGRAR